MPFQHGEYRMNIQTSKTSLSPESFELSSPALLRKHFFPRQRLKITEVAAIIGISRVRLHHRIREGHCDLRIQRDEVGLPFVTVEDLVRYLYPEDPHSTELEPECKIRRAGPGRPRKAVNGYL